MKIKKIAVSVATVLFSGLAWYFFSQIFRGSEVILGQGLNWILFGLCISISYGFLFFVSLAKDRIDFFLTSLLSVTWILVFMGTELRALISAGVIFIASATIQEFPKALARSINLQYYFSVYSKIALVVLALLGVTSIYLQSYVATNILKPETSQRTSDLIWPYVSKYITQFNSNETVDQYLAEQFREQGVENPPASVLAQERSSFSQQVGFQVRGNEPMSEVGKEFLGTKLNEYAKNFHLQQSGFYLIFLSILVLWPVGRALFGLVATLLYYLFRSTGLIQVTETQVTAKSLEI